ncbi:hypothetical protein [Nocardia amamiensis]|uniref:hypothetical protein n=1 Tax=Nocardia amamiensis TaxID=404578 RepID=UPI003F7FB5DD
MFVIRDEHPILGAMAFRPWEITDDYLGGGGSRMDWRGFPELVPCPRGWTLPDGAPRIPLNFVVAARRPG